MSQSDSNFFLQIAYAMRMSMQESASGSDDKMDVDEAAASGSKQKKGDEDYEEALNDPAVLQVSTTS